jgi:branched-chain amino acid transport system substrate-binding protein
LSAIALASVLVLFAAGCGDDDDDATTEESTTADTTETTDTTGGDTTSTSAATSAEPGASVDGTLTLGSLMPLTGDLQAYGPGMAAAVELAVEDINAAGGVLEQDVVLVSEDSGSDPTVAGPAADKLVTTENVDAIMGAAGSTETAQGVFPVATAAGRVACSGSATSPELTVAEDNGLFYRTTPSDRFQSQLLADNIAAEGYTSVAIVNRADDYGQAFADLTDEALTAAGAEVVASVAVDPDGTEFDADVQTVVDAAPEAVVLILFPEEGAPILSAMIEAGVGPADVPIYVTDGLATDELGASIDEANPAVVDGIIGTRPGASEEPTEFNTRLSEEKGVEEVTFAAQFYDCTILTALAAVSAGTDDPELIAAEAIEISRDGTKCTEYAECVALLEAGEDIDFDGITGFDLDDEGDPTAGTYEVWEFVDGAISSIETVTLTSDEGAEEGGDDTTTTTAAE